MKLFERIQNPDKIDRDLIDQNIRNGIKVIVQFSDKIYTDKILDELNELCLKYDEKLNIRFYSHYPNSFDCSVVDKIPNVKSLNIDCITNAHNIDSLTGPAHLKEFFLGINDLKETEILQSENFKGLDKLVVSATKTKALNLEYLKDYKNLTSLSIVGHTKNISVVGQLKSLTKLDLNAISKIPLDFVNDLDKLKKLVIMLGGRDNINEIQNEHIEDLSFIWIRGLNELNNLERFSNLKYLHIEDQIRLDALHFNKPINDLNYIKIINCKTLTSVTGLENLPALHHLRISQTDIDFDSFIKQQFTEALKIFAFYTFKKIDKEIKARLEVMGYVDGLS